MIGNDIIDLEAAAKESNWQRTGYLNKIFTINEQELIQKSNTPDLIVWSLWSMKEAVYKADFRRTLNFEYAPLKVECILMETIQNQEKNKLIYKSEVIYNNKKYFTFTKVLSNFIHTIAYRKNKDFFNLRTIEVKDYPENYLLFLKKNNLFSKKEIIIKNDQDVPNLLDLEINEIYPMSISHHGRFLGVIVAPFNKL